jgi:hypothetical protein
MLLIEHRVNTVAHLGRVPPERGVEVDVRDHDGRLVLAHDPFTGGEPLDDFLAAYRHALIIFNVKADGLEGPILDLVRRHGVGDHVFLDVAAPTLVALADRGVRQCAVRYSEHEPIELALAFAGKVDWVWVDCFTRLPLDAAIVGRLRRHFKICLVSPELQRHGRSAIATYRRALDGMLPDAVCSDHCDDWAA